MTRDNHAWQQLEADMGVKVQSDETPFPKDEKGPTLATCRENAQREANSTRKVQYVWSCHLDAYSGWCYTSVPPLNHKVAGGDKAYETIRPN